MSQSLKAGIGSELQAFEAYATKPTFWSQDLNDYDRIKQLEAASSTYKSFDIDAKVNIYNSLKRKFDPSLGEQVQDIGSNIKDIGADIVADPVRSYNVVADKAAPFVRPLVQTPGYKQLNDLASIPQAFQNAAVKGATFGLLDTDPLYKAQAKRLGLETGAYDNGLIQGAGELVGMTAPVTGMAGAAGKVLSKVGLFTANPLLTESIKDAFAFGTYEGLRKGSEEAMQKGLQAAPGGFAQGAVPGAVQGAVWPFAMKGLGKAFHGAKSVYKAVKPQAQAPITITPKEQATQIIKAGASRQFNQGSVPKGITPKLLDEAETKALSQQLQALKDKLDAKLAMGDITEKTLTRTQKERLEKHIQDLTGKQVASRRTLTAAKKLKKEIERRAKIETPTQKVTLQGKATRTTEGPKPNEKAPAQTQEKVAPPLETAGGPKEAQLKGSVDKMVTEGLGDSGYKTLDEVKADFDLKASYGYKKDLEKSPKFKKWSFGNLAKAKPVLKELQKELKKNPEAFGLSEKQLETYKAGIEKVISDQSKGNALPVAKKLAKELEWHRAQTAINKKLDKVHPHVKEIVGVEYDPKTGIAKQKPNVKSGSYDSVRFKLKGEDRKAGDIIDRAMRQDKGIQAPYIAEETGHTGTYRTKKLFPYAWDETTPGSDGVRFWAYNENGHAGRYYVNASANGSRLLEVPKMLNEPAYRGLYANDYKGIRDFNLSEWLGREVRSAPIKDSRVTAILETLKQAGFEIGDGIKITDIEGTKFFDLDVSDPKFREALKKPEVKKAICKILGLTHKGKA